MGEFISNKALTANQLEFINLIVDYLTEHGTVEPARLYESPFTDVSPHGPDGIFTTDLLDQLIRRLEELRESAQAS